MARTERNEPIWRVGRSDLLQTVRETGVVVLWCLGRTTLLYSTIPPPGEMTPWLTALALAGKPDSLAARINPPSVISATKETGEPSIEKADKPLVPSIGDAKGPF